MTKILDDIRDSVAENGLQREHLTMRQDIRNISRKCYNIKGVEKHANDYLSIAAWVEEMKQMEFNPVVTFKQQGTAIDEEGVRQDDFLLAVQTKFQLEMMKTFGNNVICVDAAHGTNLYTSLNLLTSVHLTSLTFITHLTGLTRVTTITDLTANTHLTSLTTITHLTLLAE